MNIIPRKMKMTKNAPPVEQSRSYRWVVPIIVCLCVLILLIFFDKQIYNWTQQIHTPLLSLVVQKIRPFGRLRTCGGIGVLLYVLGWISTKQHWKRAGVSVLLSIALTAAIIGILKPAIGRTEHFGNNPGWSMSHSFHLEDRWGRFPSGDDAMAFATAGALAIEFPAAAIVCYAVAGLVGFERVYVGSHFASDVFAAAWIGILVARLVTRRREKREHKILTKLQSLSRAFKTELKMYQLVLKATRTPRISRIFLTLAIGYLLLPFDVIPDFIPVLGQLDDLIIVPSLVALALKFIPQDVIDSCRQQAQL